MKFLTRHDRISFGRVCIRGTGVPIKTIAERFVAGESCQDLGRDYGIDPNMLYDALVEYIERYKPKKLTVSEVYCNNQTVKVIMVWHPTVYVSSSLLGSTTTSSTSNFIGYYAT